MVIVIVMARGANVTKPRLKNFNIEIPSYIDNYISIANLYYMDLIVNAYGYHVFSPYVDDESFYISIAYNNTHEDSNSKLYRLAFVDQN